ncbi:PAS domain-containing protein [Spirosoma endophyticum]|uniref:PAS domain S-box-containing protein n=1 Tax=Spirosoma endophyticum TaxID=662367 RepID=A0A1I2HVZ3_9BACT|nr:PAS domain-containing protein [Spirosoma endophyticum]SFF32907.1 PAS domain S-box-containing protein [Spirosoma endophyticum]
MPKKLTQFTQTGWALLRLALQTNHRQELKDNQAAEEQAESQLDKRHRHEMAQISLFLHPLGWTKAIARYRAQQAESLLRHKTQRALILLRQQKELVDLEQWITQQQQQSTDVALFTQLHHLFNWSLTLHQQQSYHTALNQGHTVIITDSNELILWTSQSFGSLTGHQPSDVVGLHPNLLQGPATDARMLGYVREQLRGAQPVEVELVNYHKSGSAYLCHMRIEPLYNRQGALTHFLAVEYTAEPGVGALKGTQLLT